MKKIFLVLLAVTLLFSVSACSNTGSEQGLEGDLESILEKFMKAMSLMGF